MKLLITSLVLILSLSTFAQSPETANNNASTIMVSTNATIEAKPDSYKITVVISENVQVDPNTQLTVTTKLNTIESQLLEKLKTFNVAKKDLTVSGIYEQSSVQPNYNYNYTQTQKRLMKKRIVFEESEFNQLEKIMTELRFNGVESITISPEFSEASKKSLEADLINKAITQAETDADLIAKRLKVNLGKVKGYTQYVTVAPGSINVGGYNQAYNANLVSDLSGSAQTITVSVTYEISE